MAFLSSPAMYFNFFFCHHHGFYNLSCEVRFIYRRSTVFFFISAHFLWYVPYCHFHFVIWFVLPINPIIMIRWNRRNAYGKDKNHNSSPLNWNIAFSIGFFSRMKSLLPSILFLMKNESGWIEVKYVDVFFIQHWDEFKTETFRYKLQSRSCVCRMITFFFLTVRKVLVIQTKRKSFAKLFWWLCKNIQLADFNLFRVNNTINKFDHQNRMTSSCDTFDRLKMNVKMTV